MHVNEGVVFEWVRSRYVCGVCMIVFYTGENILCIIKLYVSVRQQSVCINDFERKCVCVCKCECVRAVKDFLCGEKYIRYIQ